MIAHNFHGKKKTIATALIGLAIVVFGGYYFFTKTPPTYEEYTKAVTERIVEKTLGVPVDVKTSKPTYEHTQEALWSIAVSINSLNADVFLVPSKEETIWGDPVRFDKELTEFEEAEKLNFEKTRAGWQKIVGNASLSEMALEKIKTEGIPIFEKSLNYYKNINAISEAKVKSGGKQYDKDVFFITESMVNLIDMNLRVKQETIKGIQSKDAEMTIRAANDEDRISLVISWHEERFRELIDAK